METRQVLVGRYRDDVPDPALLLVGELARRCNVTSKTVRLYEERGLIAPIRRETNGYRLYHPGLVQELRLITMMLSLGLKLDNVRAILAPDGPVTVNVDVATTRERMCRSTQAFTAQIEAVEAQIVALAARREALRFRIRHCEEFLASELDVVPAAPRVTRRSNLPGRVAYEYECLESDSDPVGNHSHREF